MKKVAVAILNWNGRELLQKFLPSIVENTPNSLANIYVIDNASEDDSVKFVKDTFPQIKIIELDKNYGYAGGYNKAMKFIEEEYVALINSDIEVTAGWLEPLVNTLEKQENAVAVQPKILWYKDKKKFEYAGGSGGFLDKHYYVFCRGRIGDVLEEDKGQYDDEREIFWASGAAFLIKRKVFVDAGGFDEYFFAHMEEIDLAWRLKARGYHIFVNPSSVVYHVGGASLDASSPYKTFLNFRNSIVMIYKNKKSVFPFLILRLLIDTGLAFMFLFKLKFAHFGAVVKAHCQSYVCMYKHRHNRKENMKKTIVWDFEEIYPRSILWQYAVKGIKKFSDLDWKK